MTNSKITLHTVRPPAAEMGTTPEEPTWHELTITEENYNRELHKGLNWHSSVADTKDHVKYVEEWIKTYHPATAKSELTAWRKVPDKQVSGTIPSLARMQLQGLTLQKREEEKIWPYINELIKGNVSTNTVEETPTVQKPTIQDRMKVQVSAVLSEIDFVSDGLLEGSISNIDSIQETLQNPEFKAPHYKIIGNHVSNYLTEWSDAYDHWKEPDNQLAEGYAWVGKKKLKDAMVVFSGLEHELTKHTATLKIAKIRKKKPIDKAKMCAKLKYKKAGSLVEPKNLIGVSGIWAYDERHRKLCHYESELPEGIYIKGTTILGIKESFMKTLRKPEEQLKEFTRLSGKRAPKNFFDGIKSKPQAMTGRTNLDMILLGVY